MKPLRKRLILTILVSLAAPIIAKEPSPFVEKYEDEHIIIPIPKKGKVSVIGPENAYIIDIDNGESLTSLEITGDKEPIESTKKRINQWYSLFEKSINNPIEKRKNIISYKDLSEINAQKTNTGNFLLFTVTSLRAVKGKEVQSYITFLFGSLDNKNVRINHTTSSKDYTNEDTISLLNKISCKY